MKGLEARDEHKPDRSRAKPFFYAHRQGSSVGLDQTEIDTVMLILL